MGWLFMNRHHMGGHATPKSYLDAQFTFINAPDDNGIARGARVLASSCPGNRVWYAAVQYSENGVPTDVIAMVCLVKWNPRDKEAMHFGYKDMSESMGPCEAEAPENILRLLTPTTNENALDWRRRCLARLQKRSRKIVDGMRVKFPQAITFTDGFTGDEFTVIKRGATITFRPVGTYGHYRIRNFRDLEWSIVPETKVHRTVFAPRPSAAMPPP